MMREQRRELEALRVATVQPLLDEPNEDQPPFISLSFFDHRTGEEKLVPSLFVGSVPCPPFVHDLIAVSFSTIFL